jgi:predicted DsbA family dithiol-disulfide isomerase
VADALFTAYFTDGLDIGSLEVLVALGRQCGPAPGETRPLLAERR